MDLINKINDAVANSIFVGETIILHLTINSQCQRLTFSIVPQYKDYLVHSVRIEDVIEGGTDTREYLVEEIAINYATSYDHIAGFCYGYCDGYQLKK